MMPEFFVISPQKASSLRTATAPDADLAEPGHALDPRRIEAGEHAGKYAVPTRCLGDRAFERLADRFEGLVVADLEISEAWPAMEEE